MKIKTLTEYMGMVLTQRWEGKKFENIGEVHKDVISVSNTIVEEHGLKAFTWKIMLEDEWLDVFKYKFDYKQDMRYKYNVKGKMNSVEFVPTIDMDENATLEDLLFKLRKQQLEAQKINVDNRISELRKELEEAENDKRMIEASLSSMNKKTIVVAEEDARMFGAMEGRKCEVLKEEFYNGEGYYRLKDIETGEEFDSPDVFWNEIV